MITRSKAKLTSTLELLAIPWGGGGGGTGGREPGRIGGGRGTGGGRGKGGKREF